MPAATFGFADQPPGTYAVYVRAAGYQTTRILPDLLVTAEIPEVAFQTAIARQPQGLKQIGYVVTAGRTALQTTTTINTHIDTAVIQSENYQRLADVLTTVPGVITSTSSSVGDDMSLSIRGYDPTETATLLDGHPIGPDRCVRRRLQLQCFTVLGPQRRRRDLRLGRHRPLRSHDDRRRGEFSKLSILRSRTMSRLRKASAATTRR